MKAIVDCDSFYCACERLFRPDLRNRPVVVLSNNDGCIISRTDEAKALGVGMAAPYYQNRDIITRHDVSVFSSNYNLYGDLSMRVMDTLRHLVGDSFVEVYSVDEAFLDLSAVPGERLSFVAKQIKDTVEKWTGINVSIGVAPTKVLGKAANRLAKKEKEKTGCIMVLNSEELVKEALEKTAIEDIWGIGRQYAFKLKEVYGISNAWQLRCMNEEWARKNLGGIVGVRLIKELKGEPCIEMKDPLEIKKMIATTRMFGQPVYDLKDLREAIATYTSRAAEKLRRQACAARMIDVFIVTNDQRGKEYRYNPQTKHKTAVLPRATANTNELIHHAVCLVEKLYKQGPKYLKAGVILSGITPDKSIQGNLFLLPGGKMQGYLMETIDNINFSMRDDLVKFVSSGLRRNWKMRQELRSNRFTTRWTELFKIS